MTYTGKPFDLARLSDEELQLLRSAIGSEVTLFAQDILNFSLIGSGFQLNIWSSDVYQGAAPNFEVTGLRVEAADSPRYDPEPAPPWAYKAISTGAVIEDILIIYRWWEDEWESTKEPIHERLECGVLIQTDKGPQLALQEPYNLSFWYPFPSLAHSQEEVVAALQKWEPKYELVSLRDSSGR